MLIQKEEFEILGIIDAQLPKNKLFNVKSKETSMTPGSEVLSFENINPPCILVVTES